MEYLKPRLLGTSYTIMELKDILALRLRSLMDQRPDLDTQTKIHKKTGLSQSTIQRILAREVHTALDVLQKLADAYRVKPLDLIKPMGNDEQQIHIAPNYDEQQLILAWRKLTDEDQHRAMSFISVSAETRKNRQDGTARQLLVNSEQPVPASMSAAVKKASARKPGDRTGINAEDSHGKKGIGTSAKRTSGATK
jgi:transcriptional regulator with XRE-family HTH domain